MIGKGVGAFLMQTCLDIAKERGLDWVWLGVWEAIGPKPFMQMGF